MNVSFPELAALMFASRDWAHRAHLSTKHHSEHLILEEFYTKLTDDIDELIETHQGRYGVTLIPYATPKDGPEKHEVLRVHLAAIESCRYEAIPRDDSPIQNKVDEICALFLRTIYKLRRLR